jgi:hypothetical protein
MFKFVKKNVPTVKGRRPSKYDVLLEEFKTPGDTLYFDEDMVSRQTASNIAARLNKIGGGRIFRSFFDTIEKMVAVRWYAEGEDVASDEQEEE